MTPSEEEEEDEEEEEEEGEEEAPVPLRDATLAGGACAPTSHTCMLQSMLPVTSHHWPWSAERARQVTRSLCFLMACTNRPLSRLVIRRVMSWCPHVNSSLAILPASPPPETGPGTKVASSPLPWCDVGLR